MHKSHGSSASNCPRHTNTPGMPEPKQQKKLRVKKTATFKSVCPTPAAGSVCTVICGAAKQTSVIQADIELQFPPKDFLARYEAAVARGFHASVVVQHKSGGFSRAMPTDTWRAMRREGFA